MRQEKRYDVFLSHNNADKDAVESIARRLRREGLNPFLDKWHLVPGEPWQEALEEALSQSRTCAVFIGPRGIGSWEHEEMRTAIERAVSDRAFRVIPVLLPGAERGERGRLPPFLTRTTWVEFRKGLEDDDALHRLVTGVKGIRPGRALGELVDEGVCPYRGLQVFEEQHAPFLFGRDAATEWLVNELRGNRFLAVVGPSGCGKSSLVRAGLVPALRSGALPGSDEWPLCVLKPGHRPLESLALELTRVIGPSDDPAAPLRLMEALGADGRQLHVSARQALADAPAERKVGLVVDQFEEIFTLCRDEAERVSFIDNLLYASSIEGGRAMVVPTLRADFYAKCAAYPDLAARITDHQMLVSPMVEEELREAIERPAEMVGLELEGGLVEALLRDVEAQPGALPLLQHALLELWRRREGDQLTFAAYREIGGIQGAISHRAESIYASLDAEQQSLTRRVMLRLTQPGEGTEDTRRRARKSELMPSKEEAKEVEAVVEALADARLVTTARDTATGEEQVDVSHEALIRGWPRLQGWIDEDRAGLRIHRRLTEATDEWNRHGHEKSYRYRGARLTEAEQWAEEHPHDLNPLETAFLQASLAARRGRQRRQRLLIGGALIAAVVFALLASWAYLERNAADAAKVVAEYQTRLALSRQLAAQVPGALEIDPELGLLLAVEAISTTHQVDRTHTVEADSALRTALASPFRHTLRGHTGPVVRAAFSPDGQSIVTASWDGTARLWDLEGHTVAVLSGHTGRIYDAAFSPNGERIVTAGGDGTGRLWDLEGHTVAVLSGHTGRIYHAAFSPNGERIVTASGDGTGRLWDLEGHTVAVLSGHTDRIYDAAFSPNGERIVTASGDGTGRLWDLEGHTVAVLSGHTNLVRRAAFSPDGQWLVTASYDRTARLWDSNGEPMMILEGHTNDVVDAAFSPDGGTIATASYDGTARLWDVQGRPLTTLSGDTEKVHYLAFSPEGQFMVTASGDGKARVWDMQGQLVASLAGHARDVGYASFSPDAKLVVTGSDDGTARLWSLADERLVATLTGHTDPLNHAEFSSDGRLIVTASDDGTAVLWDLDGQVLSALGGSLVPISHAAFSPNGEVVATALGNGALQLWHTDGEAVSFMRSGTSWVHHVAFGPRGRLLVASSNDGLASLWSLEGELLQFLTGHTGAVNSAAFDPEGQRIVTASSDQTARVWDTRGQPVSVLTGHAAAVVHAAFSPDGQSIVTASYDGTARLWSVSGGLRVTFRGHAGSVNCAGFSPDGESIVTAGHDSTARLWSVDGAPLAILTGHTGPVIHAEFSPDGLSVLTASEDSTARVHLVDVQRLIALAERSLSRTLTPEESGAYLGNPLPMR